MPRFPRKEELQSATLFLHLWFWNLNPKAKADNRKLNLLMPAPMHEDDTQEASRLEQRENSQQKASSIETSEKHLEIFSRRRRMLTTLYVLTTCMIAGLFYYLGTWHARKVAKQEAQPQMIVETLWATPLARTHLRTHPGVYNLSDFNTRLAEAVAEDYAAFQANRSSDDASELNDLFFEHQVGETGEKNKVVSARVERLAHRKLAEFGIVARCAANLADLLLQRFGEEAVKGCKKRLQGWATLHDSSSRHGLHVHAGSTLSIVYYVRMGEGAPLRLYDPRGPRPPFEGSIEVWPEEGEMVAFPGWVAHEVDNGSGRRISLVFNVPGNWEGDEFGGESVGLGRWGSVGKGWKLDFVEGAL